MEPVQGGAGQTSNVSLILLVLALFFSAFLVVGSKQTQRDLTSKLNKLQDKQQALTLEYAQLQIEQATLTQDSRIDLIARKQLEMSTPTDVRIINDTNTTNTPNKKPAGSGGLQ